MVCSKFNSHVYKLKRWATWEHIFFLCLQLEVEIGASIGGCPMLQKIDDVPINIVS